MARTPVLPELPPDQLSYSPVLGHELRRFREAHRMSQEEVAAKLGISQRVLSRWENNRVSGLDAETLIKLGVLYGLSPNSIARIAGWWAPLDSEVVVQSSPRWEYVQRFLSNPEIEKHYKDRFVELAYTACRTVESLRESGGLERVTL